MGLNEHHPNNCDGLKPKTQEMTAEKRTHQPECKTHQTDYA